MLKKSLNLTLLLLFLFCSGYAYSGMLSVFSDINSFRTDDLLPGNAQVARNLLRGGSNVLLSRKVEYSWIADGYNTDGMVNYYNSQADISLNIIDSTLSQAQLNGIDLLVLHLPYSSPHEYNTDEVGLISNHLFNGGDVAILAEIQFDDSTIDSYNNFLNSIGSSIQFESFERCCGGHHDADTLNDSFITSDVSKFQVAGFNNLLGGIAAIQDQGFTAVSYQKISEVPIPATAWLFASALMGLVGLKHRSQL